MSDTITVKLSKPIMAHGEKMTDLTFRKPTGRDMTKCGFPWRFVTTEAGELSRTQDTAVFTAFMVALANVPPTSIDELTANDWITCMNTVTGFFGDSTTKEDSPQ